MVDFGDVIKGMRADPSKRYTRRKWGREMYVQYIPGINVLQEDWFPLASVFDFGGMIDVTIRLVPRIIKCEKNGKINLYWLADGDDMLADDWEEL